MRREEDSLVARNVESRTFFSRERSYRSDHAEARRVELLRGRLAWAAVRAGGRVVVWGCEQRMGGKRRGRGRELGCSVTYETGFGI